jgi:hypothetical protein
VDVILAFDLGMKLGWAVLSDDGARCDSGRLLFPSKPRVRRWRMMGTLVRDLLSKWTPRAVVYERPVGRRDGGGRATFLCHGGLLAMLEVEAENASVRKLVEVSPDEWKLETTGSGRTKKPRYVVAANECFGLNLEAEGDEPKGQDEAAALLIGLAAIRLGKVP